MAAIDWDAAITGVDDRTIARPVATIRYASGKRPEDGSGRLIK
jgi:hypothetical protein